MPGKRLTARFTEDRARRETERGEARRVWAPGRRSGVAILRWRWLRRDRRAAPRGWHLEDSEVQDPRRFETFMLDLMDYVDENYRTKDPETHTVFE